MFDSAIVPKFATFVGAKLSSNVPQQRYSPLTTIYHVDLLVGFDCSMTQRHRHLAIAVVGKAETREGQGRRCPEVRAQIHSGCDIVSRRSCTKVSLTLEERRPSFSLRLAISG